MSSVPPTHSDHAGDGDLAAIRRRLLQARHVFLEQPGEALAEAIRCYELARSIGDPATCARARVLQGAVSLHRGDLRGSLELLVEAERHCEECDDLAARTELAAIKAQLAFFTGSYAEAVSHGEQAVQLSDQSGDPDLRIFSRRATCLVFGNVGVQDWPQRVREVLELTVAAGDRWEEAISRNDLACHLAEQGDVAGAEREIEHGMRIAHALRGPNEFALAVLQSTRADIHLAAGRAHEALADAEKAIARLTGSGEPNLYVLGATVRVEVQARMALGQLDDARASGEGALEWLGDRLPQTRSLILSEVANALREAGRLEEAFDALTRASELERQAFRELSDLQIRLERATLEAMAARNEGDALAAKNRQLAEAHAELEHRTAQLEDLQDQLRDQADRDWLTGLHNRRFLARELERMTSGEPEGPLSLAVLDLDHFKSINDRFGHDTGDRVLVRVAGLLCDVLRESDIVVRSGGEEFVVLMPDTDARAARACCRRIRRAIRTEAWDRIATGLTLTTSAGVATTFAPHDLEAVVKVADRRLYDAKRAGRDRVVGEPVDAAGLSASEH